MAIRAHAEAEPIPGYKLIERLGGGGFGEVWKAEAPGGLMKAIKFVHGTLQSATGGEGAVQQELKSLNRVKAVRHPYILSLERYDIIDGQLMIVMELADRNLWDRFTECKGQGLPGIPREELLRYMEESAEALDLMNIQYGLQHLDIKPQNIFLVHNHVKVADFGLVKDLEGMHTQVTGGVTPVYAAPETFDGVISRWSDQYNLAIVYQELLTGQRPFNGTNVRQLLMQHMTGTPDLKSLPACDQPTIARSLSKKPEERFPSCAEMVQALRQSGMVASVLKKDLKPVAPGPLASIETPPMSPLSPTVHEKKQEPRPEPKPEPTPVVPVRQVITGEGILFPAIIIGLGRLGLKVLQQLRRCLHERCGPPEVLPNIQLLYIDSDPETMGEALGEEAEVPLSENEVVLARLSKPSHYLRPVRARISLDAWLNINMICRIPRNQVTTEGLRVLGRLAMVDNCRAISTKLKENLEAVLNPSAVSSADRHTRLGLRTNKPRVYVVSSLCGGTGGGMFIDIGYLARQQMKRLGYPEPEVIGLFLLPTVDRKALKGPALVNTFAALTELHHFSSPTETYTAYFDDADAINDPAAPFSRCVMMPLPLEGEDPDITPDVMARAGDFLCRELTSPLGRAAEEMRTELPAEPGEPLTCQTFGAYRFSQPRRLLLERAGRGVARRLVRRWLEHEGAGLDRVVYEHLAEQLAKQDLNPEGLINQLRAACQKVLGQVPETAFRNIIHKHLGQGTNIDPAGAVDALERIEEIVGAAQAEEAEEEAPITTPVVEALDSTARSLRRDWEHKLVEMVRDLVDNPSFRLAGADEAGRQVQTMLEEGVTHHQTLLEELQQRATAAYELLEATLPNLQRGSWWPGRRSKTAAEVREALEQYAKARLQSLVLECVLEVFQGLMEKIPNRLKELRFARDRLGEFLRSLEGRATESDAIVPLGPGRHFLPGKCRTFEEAVEALLRGVKPENLLELDQKLQTGIRRQFKSLLQVCLAANDAFKDLRETICQQAEAILETQMGKASIAATYLQEQGSDEDILADVGSAFDEATPPLAGPRSTSPELCFLVVPGDAAGERLGKLARSISEEVEVVSAAGALDILFYREKPRLPLADLPQLGLMVEEAYRQMSSSGHFTPHTRKDVTDWLPPA